MHYSCQCSDGYLSNITIVLMRAFSFCNCAHAHSYVHTYLHSLQVLLNDVHETVEHVTHSFERRHFNVAIAALMKLTNTLSPYIQQSIHDHSNHTDNDKKSTNYGHNNSTSGLVTVSSALSHYSLLVFTRLLAPLAPHVSAELWVKLHGRNVCIDAYTSSSSPSLSSVILSDDDVHAQTWPVLHDDAFRQQMGKVVIQVMGKVREEIKVDQALLADNDSIQTHACMSEYIQAVARQSLPSICNYDDVLPPVTEDLVQGCFSRIIVVPNLKKNLAIVNFVPQNAKKKKKKKKKIATNQK